MEAEFDRYGGEYEQLVEDSIGWSGADHAFFVEEKARRLVSLVRRHVGDPTRARVVDVGCGIGLAHRYLAGIGELHGADVSAASIEHARRENPEVRYAVADAASLPYEDGSFDVAFAVGLLHHVVPAARDAVLLELRRVAALVVVFEHNPLNPLTRLAVERCEFDGDAVLLGPAELRGRFRRLGLRAVEQRYILFFPRRGKVLRRAEDLLRNVPLGAQYYVAAR